MYRIVLGQIGCRQHVETEFNLFEVHPFCGSALNSPVLWEECVKLLDSFTSYPVKIFPRNPFGSPSLFTEV